MSTTTNCAIYQRQVLDRIYHLRFLEVIRDDGAIVKDLEDTVLFTVEVNLFFKWWRRWSRLADNPSQENWSTKALEVPAVFSYRKSDDAKKH